jgi:hypothetical protein
MPASLLLARWYFVGVGPPLLFPYRNTIVQAAQPLRARYLTGIYARMPRYMNVTDKGLNGNSQAGHKRRVALVSASIWIHSERPNGRDHWPMTRIIGATV